LNPVYKVGATEIPLLGFLLALPCTQGFSIFSRDCIIGCEKGRLGADVQGGGTENPVLRIFGDATLYIEPLPFFARLRSKFGAITP
jgi:hypothetical protein